VTAIVYAALVAAAGALCLAVRAVVVRTRRGHASAHLDPEDIAYLRGGPEDAVLVAALRLYERHGLDVTLPEPEEGGRVVRLTREEILQFPAGTVSAGKLPVDTGPLGRAVAATVRAGRPKVTQDERLTGGTEIEKLRARLAELGLLIDRQMATRMRQGALGLVLVAGFGVSAFLSGGSDEPGRFWFLAGAAVALALAVAGMARVPRLTPAGRSAVEHARDHQRQEAEILVGRSASLGYGTDEPDLAAAAADPLVVAAWGPEVVWAGQPLLAVQFGSAPPAPTEPLSRTADTDLDESHDR
jgi:uncharacterized protein (TIGR04222 family)